MGSPTPTSSAMPRIQTDTPAPSPHILGPCRSDCVWGCVQTLTLVGLSELALGLPKRPFVQGLGTVHCRECQAQASVSALPLPAQPHQVPADPDKARPSWCLQSVNACGHFCRPGRAGRTHPSCLPLLSQSTVRFASFWLQLTTALGPFPSPALAGCLSSPLALSPPMPPTLGIFLIPFPLGGLISALADLPLPPKSPLSEVPASSLRSQGVERGWALFPPVWSSPVQLAWGGPSLCWPSHAGPFPPASSSLAQVRWEPDLSPA